MQRTHIRRDIFYTFDIETTTLITGIDEEGNPIRNAIIWSGQFFDGTDFIQTRSLKDTIKRLKIIADENKESPYKVAIFVHNLSYEFQFIKDFFNFEKILCTDTRKIISAETDQLIFRCTYFLSNMSLRKFLQNENVPEKYQKTEMDYLKNRYPWTELTREEIEYCANDVIGLHMAVQNRINHEHNQDINNLPLTSTGYVRKACRKAVTGNKGNRFRFLKNRLDKDTFLMCHEAFRGGNTHANKMYVKKVINNVGSFDERSAYPAVLLLEDYPQRFTDMKIFSQSEFDFYLKNRKKWAMLIEVSFKGLRLKNRDLTPVPYISIAKCNPIKLYTENDRYKRSRQIDNGRVLECEYMRTVITEQDYLIIKNQYTWDEEKITCVKVAKKKPISKELKEQILDFYLKKTTLKQDENSPDFDADKDYLYKKSKNSLNGIYGMHVTNPCKPDYTFNNETHEVEMIPEDAEILLNRYYNSFSSFLDYQTGIWVTAYARAYLQEGIDALVNKKDKNKSDLIYCDTDSVKFINPEDHMKAIEKINAKRIKKAEKRGAYIDYNGKRYYLGIFEFEGISEKFKTFGAKKYIYGSDDKFKITISGVPKSKGKECIQAAVDKGRYKSPFDLKKGFVFHGIKTTSCYMDHTKVHEYEVEGKKVYYASNIAMYPNSYTLGLTYDFEILLHEYEDLMED